MSAQFVLLRHESPVDFGKPSHWDFMLEHESVLLCWQLNELPAVWAQFLGLKSATEGDSVAAIQLADHRLAYLDYEGPITGNRGSVARLDRGPFHWIENKEEELRIQLKGSVLMGMVKLSRQAHTWTLTVEKME